MLLKLTASRKIFARAGMVFISSTCFEGYPIITPQYRTHSQFVISSSKWNYRIRIN